MVAPIALPRMRLSPWNLVGQVKVPFTVMVPESTIAALTTSWKVSPGSWLPETGAGVTVE